jgi:hypothetical protein
MEMEYDLVKDIESRKRANSQNEIQQKSSDIGNALSDSFFGAAHEIGNMSTGALRLMGMKNAQNAVPARDSIAFGVGRAIPAVVSSLVPAMRGAQMASKMPGLASVMPSISKFLASKAILPSMAKSAITSGAYGGLTDYDDRATGAMIGVGAGALAGAAAPALSGIKSMVKKGSPQTQANRIIEQLGHGAKNLEENSEELIKSVRGNAANRIEQVREKYKPFMTSEVANEKIPTEYIKGLLAKNDIDISMKGLPKKTRDSLGKFFADPTLKKLHWAQSSLGKDWSRLNGVKNGIVDDNTLQNLFSLREDLKDSIASYASHLSKDNGNLSKGYQAASGFFKDKYLPYQEGKIAKAILTKKNKEIPISRQNIHELFAAPSEGTLKIANDLGSVGQDRILYSRLGKLLGEKSAAPELANAEKTLGNEFLGKYVTDQQRQQFKDLSESLYNHNLLKKAGLWGTGALGLSQSHRFFPHNFIGE